MSTPDSTSISSRKVFIYVLQRISDKAYLYVGSSVNPRKRFNHHRFENYYQTVRDAFSHDDMRLVVITQTDEEHRIEVERNIWKQFKAAGYPIVNDEPRPYGRSYADRALSAATRKKISDASKGNQKWLGKRHTKESRQKMSEAKKGTVISEYCKQRSSEVHKGNTHAKGLHHTAETKEKMSVAIKGRKYSEEHRRKIGEANKRRGQTPETRQKLSAIRQGRLASEETKRKISEGGKRRWAKRREEESKCE